MKHAASTYREIFQAIREMGADISDSIDWEQVQGGDRLATDLGFDSLTMLLFAIRIEDSFGVAIPHSVQFQTVNDVCVYIQEQLLLAADANSV